MNSAEYRVENGSVYEYSVQQRGYVFIGKLNGRTQAQFIREYEAEQAGAEEVYYDDTYSPSCASNRLAARWRMEMQYIKLKCLLKRRGSATRLAERSGVSQSYITRWKRAGAIVEISTGVVYLPSCTAHKLQVDEVMMDKGGEVD